MRRAIPARPVPTEFRYWDRVGDRRVQLARKAWTAVWRFDPQPADDFVREFAEAYYDADPVAEAFVDEHGVDSVGDTAHKRQLETTRFWIDVSDPGGLDPGARGRATAMRVRIMHVFIRRRLVKHPEWDWDAWGMPISIGDATLTLTGGKDAEFQPVQEFRR